jgi:hypothetical protein
VIQNLRERLFGPPLPDDARAAFEEHVVDVNRSRLRVFVPIMLLVHLAHALVFRPTEAERATLTPITLLWRTGVMTTHLATIVVVGILAMFTLRRGARFARLAGPLTAFVYLLHGAAIVDGDGPLLKGTTLGDRFVIEDLLGTGGMGSVYLGLDKSTGDRVAIKVIQASSARQLDGLHRFLREAKAMAGVSHPAIVRVLHLDISDDGLLYQVQELVEGLNLGDVLEQAGEASFPVDLDVALRVGVVLCEALAAAHLEGIVHRDVKPENVMLTATPPGLKLLDFGIAKLYDAVTRPDTGSDHDDDDDDRTAVGMILGTPSSMAPEQLLGRSEVSDRADIYALGVLLFRLVAGRFPFEGKTSSERTRHKLDGKTRRLADLVPVVDARLTRSWGSAWNGNPPIVRRRARWSARCASLCEMTPPPSSRG